jgi:hypothetical protein
MAGPSRPQRNAGNSLAKPATKRAYTFDSPDWLVDLVAKNAKKADIPENYLSSKLQELATDDSKSLYPAKKKRKSVIASEDLDLMEQEKDMRQAELDRVASTHAESSTAGAAANQKAPIATSNRNLALQDVESSASLFVPESLTLPSWYTSLHETHLKKLKRATPDQNQAIKALSSMKTCMENCEKKTSAPTRAQLEKLFDELRDHIHKAEILLKVDKLIVRKAFMLHETSGLPRIFASPKVDYPWDIRADARQLYRRWREGVFEIDPLRGIKSSKDKDRASDSIDPAWKHRVSPKFYGEGNLIPGQWWPTQLTTVRDGAHGSPQGGIYGEKEKGAYSLVLSGGGPAYGDEDNGDEIWYSGTDGSNFTPTENTTRLIESCNHIHNQVRVLRSHQLPKNNPYRPEVGLRYDGLYEVVEQKLVDREKARYKFKLVRSKGQFPIRCRNNAASRPTRFEIDEDDKLRRSGRS